MRNLHVVTSRSEVDSVIAQVSLGVNSLREVALDHPAVYFRDQVEISFMNGRPIVLVQVDRAVDGEYWAALHAMFALNEAGLRVLIEIINCTKRSNTGAGDIAAVDVPDDIMAHLVDCIITAITGNDKPPTIEAQGHWFQVLHVGGHIGRTVTFMVNGPLGIDWYGDAGPDERREQRRELGRQTHYFRDQVAFSITGSNELSHRTTGDRARPTVEIDLKRVLLEPNYAAAVRELLVFDDDWSLLERLMRIAMFADREDTDLYTIELSPATNGNMLALLLDTVDSDRASDAASGQEEE